MWRTVPPFLYFDNEEAIVKWLSYQIAVMCDNLVIQAIILIIPCNLCVFHRALWVLVFESPCLLIYPYTIKSHIFYQTTPWISFCELRLLCDFDWNRQVDPDPQIQNTLNRCDSSLLEWPKKSKVAIAIWKKLEWSCKAGESSLTQCQDFNLKLWKPFAGCLQRQCFSFCWFGGFDSFVLCSYCHLFVAVISVDGFVEVDFAVV